MIQRVISTSAQRSPLVLPLSGDEKIPVLVAVKRAVPAPIGNVRESLIIPVVAPKVAHVMVVGIPHEAGRESRGAPTGVKPFPSYPCTSHSPVEEKYLYRFPETVPSVLHTACLMYLNQYPSPRS